MGRDAITLTEHLDSLKVSIHAPTWGATFDQPAKQNNNKVVSIHAPTWGATMVFEVSDGMEGSFNPRAHVGRDSYSNFLLQTPLMFQSTRPRGARPATGRTHTITLSFNPRAHVGRDPLPGSGCCWATGFNPRAHVGRDRTSLLALSSRFVSIHAPTWGATWRF